MPGDVYDLRLRAIIDQTIEQIRHARLLQTAVLAHLVDLRLQKRAALLAELRETDPLSIRLTLGQRAVDTRQFRYAFVEIVRRIGMRTLDEIDRPFRRHAPLFLSFGVDDYRDIRIAIE